MGQFTRGLAIFFAALAANAATAQTQQNFEDFDGSFRLQTGEVVSGGYFVEDAQGSYMFFDTENLDRMGLFRRIGETSLRSIFPPDSIEIEFERGGDGRFDRLIWREQGQEPIAGSRIAPHISRAISFRSADGTLLHGRLMTPQCPGPHPAIISVAGSGPVDRHAGTYHMFFLRRGMAVIAYDKRGYSADGENWREPDLAEMQADITAGYRFAVAQPEIDGNRTGIIANSQAGWFVPQAAIEVDAPAFLIYRAGALLPHSETQLHENRQEWRSEGLSGIDLDSAVALMREIYAIALSGAPIEDTDASVAPYLERDWYRIAFGEGPISARWSARYWSWVQRNYAVSPVEEVAAYRGPVLWFLGEADQNVPYVATRAAISQAFAHAPDTDREIVSLPGAEHSFLIREDGVLPRFSGGFFGRMESWLEERGFTNANCFEARD